MDWQDFWGQLVGGALGVLVGFGASEALASWRRRGSREAVHAAVLAEIRQNQVSINRVARVLDTDDEDAKPVENFSRSARPSTSTVIWSTHLTSPDAFSNFETEQILDFYEAIKIIEAIWDQVQKAVAFDVERENINSPTAGQLRPYSGYVTPHAVRTMQQLLPQLRGAILFVQDFDLK